VGTNLPQNIRLGAPADFWFRRGHPFWIVHSREQCLEFSDRGSGHQATPRRFVDQLIFKSRCLAEAPSNGIGRAGQDRMQQQGNPTKPLASILKHIYESVFLARVTHQFIPRVVRQKLVNRRD